jgi:phosphoglycerate dehydrogenase-like enzyme
MTLKLLIADGVCPRLETPNGVDLMRVDPSTPLSADMDDAQALVAWGMNPRWLRDAAGRLRQLQWVQSLGAGAEQALRAGFADHVVITNGAGLHDAPVAEHALSLLLAAARRLDLLRDDQKRRHWSDRGGVQPGDEALEFSTLRNRHIVIWGFGGIGQTLAHYVSALGASVTGVARTAGERAGFPVVGVDDVEHTLPKADALVLTLPGGEGTRRILDANRIALLPPQCWVVNVGRGTCIDELALTAALDRGMIAGAALDVVEVEPLPPESPLWSTANVIITPHAAGGRPLGAEELIRHNASALLGYVQWRNRVER